MKHPTISGFQMIVTSERNSFCKKLQYMTMKVFKITPLNQFSTSHRQVDYRADQDQIEQNSIYPTSDLTCLARDKCRLRVNCNLLAGCKDHVCSFRCQCKCIPITIISFKLKLLTGRKGVPISLFLLCSSFLKDQKRRAQATAVAVAQIAASLDIILSVSSISRLGDSNCNQIVVTTQQRQLPGSGQCKFWTIWHVTFRG